MCCGCPTLVKQSRIRPPMRGLLAKETEFPPLVKGKLCFWDQRRSMGSRVEGTWQQGTNTLEASELGLVCRKK